VCGSCVFLTWKKNWRGKVTQPRQTEVKKSASYTQQTFQGSGRWQINIRHNKHEHFFRHSLYSSTSLHDPWICIPALYVSGLGCSLWRDISFTGDYILTKRIFLTEHFCWEKVKFHQFSKVVLLQIHFASGAACVCTPVQQICPVVQDDTRILNGLTENKIVQDSKQTKSHGGF